MFLRGSNTNMGIRTVASRELLSTNNTNAVSQNFQIFFGAALGSIVLLQVLLLATVYKYRNVSTLKLYQPYALMAYVGIAAFGTACCILFIPFNDTSCLIRECFILLPITLMGNILVARSWRLSILMAPALGIGASSRAEESTSVRRRKRAKEYLVEMLSKINLSFLQGRTTGRTTLQLKVTSQQLVCLAITLTIPQLVVQMCKVFIPSLQSELGYSSVCLQTVGGNVMSWVGLSLAIFPLILWVILCLYTGDLPLLKVYAKSARRTVVLIFVVVAIAVPVLIISDSIETTVYLQTCLVVAFTGGTSWFVVIQKLLSMLKDEQKHDQMAMLRVEREEVHAGYDSDENQKAVELALKIGKVYEECGMVDKSIDKYNEHIQKYKFDQRKPGMKLIGGFTQTEIDSFTHVDLASIMKLFVAKGKACGTYDCSIKKDNKYGHGNVYIDGLDIYEHCSSAALLEDHSCIFPIFSGLFLQIKGSAVKLDERGLVDKFVRVTKMNGDLIHYTRALAMKCEVNARYGDFRISLLTLFLLETIYDAKSQHEGLCKSYGSDREAQAFGAAIFWNRQEGNKTEAKRLQNLVVREILPMQNLKNVHNAFMLLLPVVKEMKNNGEFVEAKKLFDEYVWKSYVLYIGEDGTTPCLTMFKPIRLLLDAHIHGIDMPDLHEVLEWAATEGNGVCKTFLDDLITSLGWSTKCLMAECCLELSKIAHETNQSGYEDKLKQKGLVLAREAYPKIVDKETGRVKFPIAYADVDYILTALDNEYVPSRNKAGEQARRLRTMTRLATM